MPLPHNFVMVIALIIVLILA